MMKLEQEQLYKNFEEEFLLYLDGDLSPERISYWDSMIDQYPDLKKYTDEYWDISNEYANVKNIELSEEKFNKYIDQAVMNNSLIEKLNSVFNKLFSNEKEISFGKIAFASLLIIGAIVVSVISNRPNPVINLSETINEELLKWDADYVDSQISKVGTLLKVTKDDEYRKYYKYNLSVKDVDKNINIINSNIKSLKEELSNKKL